MNILKSTIAVAIAATAIGGASQAIANPTAIRCSHQLPPKHHIAKVIDRWAEEVETALKRRARRADFWCQ